jgi:hypothetical protein
MAVDAAALLTPAGRLDPEVLWPDLSLTKVKARLTAFLADGYAQEGVSDGAQAQQDRFARSWAYGRSYGEVYERLVALPTSVEVTGKGASSYLVTQVQLMKELRDEAYAAAAAVLEEIGTDEEAPPAIVPPRSSASTPIRYTW